MFFEPQLGRREGSSPQKTCELSFARYLEALESFSKRLPRSANFPNVLLPMGCSSPLKDLVITLQPEVVVSSYAQLFGRLPGSVVVLPQSAQDFVDLSLFNAYFENWFRPIYGYCPEIWVLPDEELFDCLKQGKIHFKDRSLDLICYYPVNSQNFLLGNKGFLRRCLEDSPVKECAEILVPGEICAGADLEATLKKAFQKWSKVVVQAPTGAGGFGTWVIEKSNKSYTLNDKLHHNLQDIIQDIIKEIQAQAEGSSEFIVMEYIEHTPVSVGAVLAENGYYTLGPFRRQLVNGASYKGVYFESTQPPGVENVRGAIESFLKHHCDNLDNPQNLPPVIGFDFLLADQPPGKLYITECNPRQTGALPLEMLLVSVKLDKKPLYSRLFDGSISAFQLDHCRVPTEWAGDLGLFEREFSGVTTRRFGLNMVFLPPIARENGAEAAVETALLTPDTILVAPATPPNPTGKIALQFVAPPEVLQKFFDELTNGGRNLEVNF